MKKNLLYLMSLAVLMLASACSSEDEILAPENPLSGELAYRTIKIAMPDATTRATVGEDETTQKPMIYWQEDDRVAVYYGNEKKEFKVTATSEFDNTAVLTSVNELGEIPANAKIVYPLEVEGTTPEAYRNHIIKNSKILKGESKGDYYRRTLVMEATYESETSIHAMTPQFALLKVSVDNDEELTPIVNFADPKKVSVRMFEMNEDGKIYVEKGYEFKTKWDANGADNYVVVPAETGVCFMVNLVKDIPANERWNILDENGQENSTENAKIDQETGLNFTIPVATTLQTGKYYNLKLKKNRLMENHYRTPESDDVENSKYIFKFINGQEFEIDKMRKTLWPIAAVGNSKKYLEVNHNNDPDYTAIEFSTAESLGSENIPNSLANYRKKFSLPYQIPTANEFKGLFALNQAIGENTEFKESEAPFNPIFKSFKRTTNTNLTCIIVEQRPPFFEETVLNFTAENAVYIHLSNLTNNVKSYYFAQKSATSYDIWMRLSDITDFESETWQNMNLQGRYILRYK